MIGPPREGQRMMHLVCESYAGLGRVFSTASGNERIVLDRSILSRL